MRLTFERPWASILGPVTDDDLPDFVLMSGPNGAGKSNLLEAIRQRTILIDGITTTVRHPYEDKTVRLFPVTQLVPAVDSNHTMAQFQENWKYLENIVTSAKQTVKAQRGDLSIESEEFGQLVSEAVAQNSQLSSSLIQKLEREADKPIAAWTTDDFWREAPVISGKRDPFSLTISEVFLSYHVRRIKNLINMSLDHAGEYVGTWIPASEFERRHGEPPWTLLNRVLGELGQPYEFDHPQGYEVNIAYEPRLTNIVTGSQVGISELSSGEKVILVVATSLYAGSALDESLELPKVLLFDEPDALLHPSMIEKLLTVIQDVFVRQYGAKVFLASHSPTTVALAPEDSLYVMSPVGDRRLTKASSRDEALRHLTVGLPTLSVKIENRRQVFVESEVDEYCYDIAYRCVRNRCDGPVTLHFIASGRGGAGSRDAVKELVKALRGGGNTSVLGIVDRNASEGTAPDGIFVDSERYSLENYVLDPYIIGAFLMRERKVSATALGIPTDIAYMALVDHAQALVDGILRATELKGDDNTPTTCNYAGGTSVVIPAWYLNIPGHRLEERLKTAFPSLRAYRGHLLQDVADKMFRDIPDCVPQRLLSLFRRLSQP